MADLVRKLSEAGVRVIAVDILLSEPEASGELRTVGQLSERLRTQGLAHSPAGVAVQSVMPSGTMRCVTPPKISLRASSGLPKAI